MKKFTEIHIGLSEYKMSLMQEANSQGTPVTRPLLLHWPESDTARAVDSQFMLGENIMMAPAFLADIEEIEMFLPGPENWLNLWTKTWTNTTEEGLTFNANCSLGYPAVYLRSTDGFDAMTYANILNPSPSLESSNLKTILLATCIPAALILVCITTICICKKGAKTDDKKEKLNANEYFVNGTEDGEDALGKDSTF
jgi:hypothetical protein